MRRQMLFRTRFILLIGLTLLAVWGVVSASAGTAVHAEEGSGEVAFSIRPQLASEERPESFSYFSRVLGDEPTINETAIITNEGDAPVVLHLYVADASTGINGGTSFANADVPIAGHARWIVLSMNEVSLLPGEQRIGYLDPPAVAWQRAAGLAEEREVDRLVRPPATPARRDRRRAASARSAVATSVRPACPRPRAAGHNDRPASASSVAARGDEPRPRRDGRDTGGGRRCGPAPARPSMGRAPDVVRSRGRSPRRPRPAGSLPALPASAVDPSAGGGAGTAPQLRGSRDGSSPRRAATLD